MKNGKKKLTAWLLAGILLLCQLSVLPALAEEPNGSYAVGSIVLTLGADLTADQVAYIYQYFGVTEGQVQTVTITNEDEKKLLQESVPLEKIGSNTLSCAMIRITSSGGVVVKTANMNYVTSDMISKQVVLCKINNCEVLTAAPFEVSGTGALTGVIMAYESATGQKVDEAARQMAVEDMVVTQALSDKVGQQVATLIVNDIEIIISRDQITDQAEIRSTVDNVVDTTQQAAQVAGVQMGAQLGQVEKDRLYALGNKFSQMGYKYSDMQPTMERVTHNMTTATGIDDPIEDTFTTLTDDFALSLDSILLGTNDDVLGEGAIINATNSVAVGDREPETIEVFTGDVTLTSAGTVAAERFISYTDVVAYRDTNGCYALMDLNGNKLTDSVYDNYFHTYYGRIEARLAEESASGVLGTDGSILIPFEYPVVEILSSQWGVGFVLTEGTEEDYDSYGFRKEYDYYQIARADVYYFGDGGGTPVGSLDRSQYKHACCKGDYINITDRGGQITLYDSSFTVLNSSVEYETDFGAYDEEEALCQALSEKTGYDVEDIYGNYGCITDFSAEDPELSGYGHGIVDRYGNIIIPMVYDRMDRNQDEEYVSDGYFAAERGDKVYYLTQGGTVTACYDYADLQYRNYGMAAYNENADGTYSICAADGTETKLGSEYDDLRVLSESKGMLWKGHKNGNYDLIDWHGNVLISGASDYSVSKNGNYLIAQDGYTSNTLYLINGASMVGLADSAGGASEVKAAFTEAASLEAYTGDPKLVKIGTLPEDGIDYSFIYGTNLICVWGNNHKHAVFSETGEQLTDYLYDEIQYKEGWLEVTQGEYYPDRKMGLLSMDGRQAIPCEYDVIQVLNENWAYAGNVSLTESEDDYDCIIHTESGSSNAVFETIKIYHLSSEEVSSVEVTREQAAGIEAEEEYLNIKDASTGVTTTYDNTFTAIGSPDYVSDFKAVSSTWVRHQQIEDMTGMTPSDDKFENGYERVYMYDHDTDETKYGVVDTDGNIVIPAEYDRIFRHDGYDGRTVWCNGYFCAVKDGKLYFLSDGYEFGTEYNDYDGVFGMAVRHKNQDGTYSIISADGKVSGGYAYLGSDGWGLIWKAEKSGQKNYDIVDWHGNVLLSQVQCEDISTDNHVIAGEDGQTGPAIYAIADFWNEEQGEMTGEASQEQPIVQSGEDIQVLSTASGENETQEEPAVQEASDTQNVSSSQEESSAQDASALPAQSAAPAVSDTQSTTAETEDDASAALLDSAKMLLQADAESNKGSVIVLLKQAGEKLSAAGNSSAASVIDSAVLLLETGNVDAGYVITLIDSALQTQGTIDTTAAAPADTMTETEPIAETERAAENTKYTKPMGYSADFYFEILSMLGKEMDGTELLRGEEGAYDDKLTEFVVSGDGLSDLHILSDTAGNMCGVYFKEDVNGTSTDVETQIIEGGKGEKIVTSVHMLYLAMALTETDETDEDTAEKLYAELEEIQSFAAECIEKGIDGSVEMEKELEYGVLMGSVEKDQNAAVIEFGFRAK